MIPLTLVSIDQQGSLKISRSRWLAVWKSRGETPKVSCSKSSVCSPVETCLIYISEWHQVTLKTDLLAWVARMSTRIFLGPDFVRNEEWLRISVEMTVDAFTACFICKFLPRLLRWPTERLLPLCRKVRSDHRACSRILAPVLKQRRQEIATAQREGRKPNLPDDSIEWFRNASNGRAYDETDIQLGLAMAAIHTTSDLLCQTILNLCANPELFEPLRKEVVAVMQKHGWRKLALTELRLLDSVLKETQRIKPVEMSKKACVATILHMSWLTKDAK